MTASASKRLYSRLPTTVTSDCQRLLTAGFEACGGILDGRERLVDLEHVGDDLCARRLEAVAGQTANESRIAVSWAADTCMSGKG